MDKLVTPEEVQALVALFSKTPMTPAELLWANMFATRLFAYTRPTPPLEKSETVDHAVDLVDIRQPEPAQDIGGRKHGKA